MSPSEPEDAAAPIAPPESDAGKSAVGATSTAGPEAEAAADGAAPVRKRRPRKPKAAPVDEAATPDNPVSPADANAAAASGAAEEAATTNSPPASSQEAEGAAEHRPQPSSELPVGEPTATTAATATGDGSEPEVQSAARPEAFSKVDEQQGDDRGATDDDDRADDEDEDEEPDEEEDDLDRARRAAEREQRNMPAPEPIRFADVISGQFDADEDSPEVPALKRVLLPEADSPKLHKVLAQAGLGSRLEMEQLILQGRISVNNEPAHIGQRIQFGDQVKVNGKPIRFRIDPPPARVIAYHKPVGEVVTHDDPQNRPTVFRKLPRLQQGKWQSVGRLDLNTEGLLLFTSSGGLANQLMHPRFGLEREYAVRVLGALSADEKKKLLEGVRLDDGMAHFGSIEEGGGEGSNCWYQVTISEGRNREVRRLFEAVGHAVSRLIRIRYGAMVLPRGLKRGAWMELDERDIQALFQAAGGGNERGPRGNAPRQRGQGQGPGGQGGQGQGPDGGARNGRNRKRRGNRNGGGASFDGRDPSIPNPLGGGGPRGRNDGGGPAQQGRRNRGDQRGDPRGDPRGGANRNTDDRRPSGANQPDPMKTSVGYIGADSFSRQRKEQRSGQRRSGPPGGNFGGQGGGRRRGR